MSIPITRSFRNEGPVIGWAEHSDRGLVIRMNAGYEIPENQIEQYFGLVEFEVITFLPDEGSSGCYRKIRAFRISSWGLPL